MTYLSYKKARAVVCKNKIQTSREFFNWEDRPEDVPSNPSLYYKKEWVNWYDFLCKEKKGAPGGKTNRIFKRMASYNDAEAYMHDLHAKGEGVKSANDYIHWKDRPKFLPLMPNNTYSGRGWENWRRFLGTEFLTMKELSALCKEHNIISLNDLKTSGLYKSHNIPLNLPLAFKSQGFVSFDKSINSRFLSYKEAKTYIKKHHPDISTSTKYMAWPKEDRPAFIPARPQRNYADEGFSWSDYLRYKD